MDSFSTIPTEYTRKDPPFMNKFFLDWIDDRSGIRGLIKDALYEKVPGGARWRYVWEVV